MMQHSSSWQEAESSVYEPLEHKDSIRLLRLHPALSSTEPLVGDFVVHSLSDHEPPMYQALSYMWGDETPRQGHEITIAGIAVPLRSNLHDALVTIRSHRQRDILPGFDFLWIDSICIEQDNILEKNHQVQQMGQIYFQASRVLIWLGQATQISLISSPFWIMTKGAKLSIHDTLTRNHNASAVLCRSLLNLHWTRTWILQEIGLASTYTILADSRIYTEADLRKFMGSLVIDSLSGIPQMAVAGISTLVMTRLYSIWNFRKDMRKSTRGRPGLCEMIQWLGVDSQCALDRDKVFALLPITSAEHDIKVDYRVDRVVLFWRVLRTDHHQPISIKKIASIAAALDLDHAKTLLSTKRLVQIDNQVRYTHFLCRLGNAVNTTQGSSLFGPLLPESDQRHAVSQMLCFFNSSFSKQSSNSPAFLHLYLAQASKDIYIVKRANFYPQAYGTRRFEGIDLTGSSIKHLGSDSNIRRNLKDSSELQSSSKRSKHRLTREEVDHTKSGKDSPLIRGYLSIDPILLITIFFLAHLTAVDCETNMKQVFPSCIMSDIGNDLQPNIKRYIGNSLSSSALDDPIIFIEDPFQSTTSNVS